MPIDIYAIKYSPPCRAVLMTAKHLNIDLNFKIVDLSEGNHLNEDYLKINPAHTVPTIDDNGFILWESRAIMQYLCNQYAPNSSLYPKNPKQRALVDRWLNFDLSLFNQLREAQIRPMMTEIPASEQSLKAFKDSLTLLETLIGDNSYLTGDNLTIADLSMVATVGLLPVLKPDFAEELPKLSAWISRLSSELPYFEEINKFSEEEIKAFIEKMKAFFAKLMQKKD